MNPSSSSVSSACGSGKPGIAAAKRTRSPIVHTADPAPLDVGTQGACVNHAGRSDSRVTPLDSRNPSGSSTWCSTSASNVSPVTRSATSPSAS